MSIESVGARDAMPLKQTEQSQSLLQGAKEYSNNGKYAEQTKEAREISVEKLEAAINQINELMRSSQRSLNFSVDKASDKVVVQVRDTSTNKVIRQIPNQEALRFAESFDRLMGVIFDKKT